MVVEFEQEFDHLSFIEHREVKNPETPSILRPVHLVPGSKGLAPSRDLRFIPQGDAATVVNSFNEAILNLEHTQSKGRER